VDHVREARRQKLRKDFDKLAFNVGETIEDFLLPISAIVSELQSLSDKTSELDGVQKIRRVVLARYTQMACSIETLPRSRDLSIEELSRRLLASEGHGGPKAETGGRLLLTEEEWNAHAQQCVQGSSSRAKDG
jgi:hypothetical protein